MSKGNWTVEPEFKGSAAGDLFCSMSQTFSVKGVLVAASPISSVEKMIVGEKAYYVKRYFKPGQRMSGYIGRSRVRGEWENLLLFRKQGLAVPPIVAYGEQGGKGALITEEVPNTSDLAELAKKGAEQLQNVRWVKTVSDQVAHALRTLHSIGFAHNDFKWRNILVTEENRPKVYLIDCPVGRYWWGPFLEYRKIKDLACLDKIAKYQLSEEQRLGFYLTYVGKERLEAMDKKRIKKIKNFFKGRE